MAKTKIGGQRRPTRNQARVLALLRALAAIQEVDVGDLTLYDNLVNCRARLMLQEAERVKAKSSNTKRKKKTKQKSEADASDDESFSAMLHEGEVNKKRDFDTDGGSGPGDIGGAGITSI